MSFGPHLRVTAPSRSPIGFIIKLMFGGGLLFFAISMITSAFLFPYVLNSWLVFAHKPASIMWWHGALIGILPPLTYLSLIAAIATWIIMLFLK